MQNHPPRGQQKMSKRDGLSTSDPFRSRERLSLLTHAASGERMCVCRESEKGAEVVEFAVVLSTLLILVFGIFSMARAYNIYQSITRAAREGARVAVLPSSAANGNQYLDSSGATVANSAVFQDYIAPALRASSLDPGKVSNYTEQVTWLDAGDTSQQCGVQISFQYPYRLLLPMLRSNLTTIQIATHVQMRREDQPSNGSCP
jgi:Flp pilus assembly protein TadG